MAGKARGENGNSVREQLLVAATRLFAARGFDGTSLQDVADAVGIRKPSVLHHFPSKEALRVGVLDAMLGHWGRVLPQALRAATGPSPGALPRPAGAMKVAGDEHLHLVTREMVRFFAADPDRARVLIRETLDRPREVRRLFLTHLRPWLDVIAGFIREGQAAGRYHPDLDPESFLVHMLHLIVVGIALGGIFVPTTTAEAKEREVQELVRIARTSLFRPPPDASPTTRRSRS